MTLQKTYFAIFCALIISSLFFSSCTTLNRTIKEPNVRVELQKSDFSLSEQVSAEAKATKILGIDFERLFTKKTATSEGSSSGISLATLPVVGNVLSDKTANYALYELLEANKGYDVIFYPQYETKVVKPFLGIGFIMKTTTVKTTARLGKLTD
jgi:hypothetical protein